MRGSGGGKYFKYGGHNLPPPCGIGITETPNSRWAKTHPDHPLTASVISKGIVKTVWNISSFDSFDLCIVNCGRVKNF